MSNQNYTYWQSGISIVGECVYVVTAIDSELKVKEQYVYAHRMQAEERFDVLKKEYGGSNVCLASREIW